MINDIKITLREYANKDKAEKLQRYFKTAEGEYGEGDEFLGVSVPDSRKIAKKYMDIDLKELQKLLNSKVHEERFIATEILNFKFKKAISDKEKKELITFYINNLKGINNWDLVDNTAYSILGEWLTDKERKLLYSFSQSSSLWERRISVVATYAFIKRNEFDDTLKIAQRLLQDKEDLIHKAVGWMLREVGKRDKDILDKFLEKNYTVMPRTMLRYAIEKHPDAERKMILQRK